jgi:hypothetical protein
VGAFGGNLAKYLTPPLTAFDEAGIFQLIEVEGNRRLGERSQISQIGNGQRSGTRRVVKGLKNLETSRDR